jgi:hypothetical protein
MTNWQTNHDEIEAWYVYDIIKDNGFMGNRRQRNQ